MGESINDPMEQRRAKLLALKARGLDPFETTQYPRTHHAAEVAADFERLEGRPVAVAGRLMAQRGHGKASFIDLRDETGKIQVHVKIDRVGEDAYDEFQALDLGDILGVSGEVFRTRRGEVSIAADTVSLLAKALQPPPEKWHGLTDVEQRYRRRYVDLMVNEEVQQLFRARSLILRGVRRFLDDRGFLEVETPMLHPIAGGAAARPFITHHNALDMDLYLRIAPELYLKRLIVGGFEKVYEVNRNFRNEGVSTRHNPEFTMVEVYQAYVDYQAIMKLTEELVAAVCTDIHGEPKVAYGEEVIDLTPPWRRVPLYEMLQEFSGIDFGAIQGNEAVREAARRANVSVPDGADFAKVVDEVLKKHVVPNVMQPTFLVDYPVELSPLAKRKPGQPQLTDRFQAVVRGLELANAFSEVNDALDQRDRFEAQQQKRTAGDEEAHPMDEDFLRALECGMPPTGGLGIGIDRLVMILTSADSIREVILFPLLRHEQAGGEQESTTTA